MKRQVILDAGPIVALLNKNDQFHAWAHAQFGRFVPPALTCEGVIDACLVRMAEIHSGSAVATLDSDFAIYRKQGRQVIPLITPLKR